MPRTPNREQKRFRSSGSVGTEPEPRENFGDILLAELGGFFQEREEQILSLRSDVSDLETDIADEVHRIGPQTFGDVTFQNSVVAEIDSRSPAMINEID